MALKGAALAVKAMPTLVCSASVGIGSKLTLIPVAFVKSLNRYCGQAKSGVAVVHTVIEPAAEATRHD